MESGFHEVHDRHALRCVTVWNITEHFIETDRHDETVINYTQAPDIKLLKQMIVTNETFVRNVCYGEIDKLAAMMLRSLPPENLRELYIVSETCYGGIRFLYFAGKQLKMMIKGHSLSIYDIRTFFGQDLKQVLDTYKAKDLRDLTQKMCKAMELELDGEPENLSGPSALAKMSEKLNNVDKSRNKYNDLHHQQAVQSAYYGGRIECLQFGNFENVGRLDLRSAYGWALTFMPSLVGTRYEDCDKDCDITDISIYDYGTIRYECNDENLEFHPFPHRDDNELVSFPGITQTVVWGPELRMAMGSKFAKVLWHRHLRFDFESCSQIFPDPRPFRYMHDLYDRRLECSPLAKHLQKSAIVSTYGRAAQWRGWDITKNKPPSSHQLEWAGIATSMVRSRIYGMCSHLGWENIIAIETDGIYFQFDNYDMSEVSLKEHFAISETEQESIMGEWSFEVIPKMTYVASGVFFSFDEKGNEINKKTRGLKTWMITHDDVKFWWKDYDYAGHGVLPTMSFNMQRYKTIPIATMQDKFDELNTTEDYVINYPLYPTGRRMHAADCVSSWSKGNHRTVSLPPYDYHSRHYPLPWVSDEDYNRSINTEIKLLLANGV